MDKQSIIQYKSAFDAIETYIESDNRKEHIEVWFARDLQKVLGYARWENFQTAINRAVESCNTQGVNVDDHFREVTKMVCRRAATLKKRTTSRQLCVKVVRKFVTN